MTFFRHILSKPGIFCWYHSVSPPPPFLLPYNIFQAYSVDARHILLIPASMPPPPPQAYSADAILYEPYVFLVIQPLLIWYFQACSLMWRLYAVPHRHPALPYNLTFGLFSAFMTFYFFPFFLLLFPNLISTWPTSVPFQSQAGLALIISSPVYKVFISNIRLLRKKNKIPTWYSWLNHSSSALTQVFDNRKLLLLGGDGSCWLRMPNKKIFVSLRVLEGRGPNWLIPEVVFGEPG